MEDFFSPCVICSKLGEHDLIRSECDPFLHKSNMISKLFPLILQSAVSILLQLKKLVFVHFFLEVVHCVPRRILFSKSSSKEVTEVF